MSKLHSASLKESIVEMLAESQKKHRKFTETVELQIGLKNYDPAKDKRFSGVVKLSNPTKFKQNVCVLGDAFHMDIAKKAGLPCMDVEALAALKKDKKLVKKLAAKYSGFVASEALLKQIPRLLGPGLNKAGKFPTAISHADDIKAKLYEMNCQVKFQLKKTNCLAVAVGNVTLTPEQIQENVERSVNFLASLLKKNWQNIKSLHIKTTMGAPKRIY